MVKPKRPQANGGPPARRRKVVAGTGSNTAIIPEDSHENIKDLSSPALAQEVEKMVENKERAELMILDLMRTYSFSFPRFKELLTKNNLDVNVSRVQYADIAPMAGLKPFLEGEDIPTFELFRARLPNRVFSRIIQDLQTFSAQYGPLDKHKNEEARSRYLSGYFNQIVALFSGLLFNTPETLLEGRLTTKGRIEYQFKTYGGITIVFIEVKLDIGTLAERLNCIAQVIAECSACAWVNYQNGFDVPIMAVLCDGKHFYFYKFVDQHHSSPRFALGIFPDGDKRISIDDIEQNPSVDFRAFIKQVRITCDSLYYVFLSGYCHGLEAYWRLSVEAGQKQDKERLSTPGWSSATTRAKEALEIATLAWQQHQGGELDKSKESAGRAVELLQKSIEEAPFSRPNLMANYTEDMADI